MNTITIGSRTFATNLFWQTAAGVAVSKRAVREQAKTSPANNGTFKAIVVRSTRPPQYGVSTSDNADHAIGMTSAAAALADMIDENFAGVFSVPEGWYFLVCVRGMIDSESDLLFARDDAKAAQHALETALQDKRIQIGFAPPDWDIKGSGKQQISNQQIDPILSKADRAWMRLWSPRYLAPLNATKANVRASIRYAAAAGALALIVLGGRAFWPIAEHWLFGTKNRGTVQVPDPWEREPLAAEMMTRCTSAVLSHPELPGAPIRTASCYRESVSYHYETASPVARALIDPRNLPAGCALSADDDTHLSVKCDLAHPAVIGKIQPLSQQEATNQLWRRFGSVGAAPKITGVSLTAGPPNQPRPPGKSMSVGVTLSFPPSVLAHAVAEIPAYAVTAINFTAPGSWQVEGKIYVR